MNLLLEDKKRTEKILQDMGVVLEEDESFVFDEKRDPQDSYFFRYLPSHYTSRDTSPFVKGRPNVSSPTGRKVEMGTKSPPPAQKQKGLAPVQDSGPGSQMTLRGLKSLKKVEEKGGISSEVFASCKEILVETKKLKDMDPSASDQQMVEEAKNVAKSTLSIFFFFFFFFYFEMIIRRIYEKFL